MLRASLFNQKTEFVEPAIGANHGFETNRFAGDPSDSSDCVEKILGAINSGVSIWTDGVLTFSNRANTRNLAGHLGSGQDAALAWFSALTQLNLEHANLLVCSHCR